MPSSWTSTETKQEQRVVFLEVVFSIPSSRSHIGTCVPLLYLRCCYISLTGASSERLPKRIESVERIERSNQARAIRALNFSLPSLDYPLRPMHSTLRAALHSPFLHRLI